MDIELVIENLVVDGLSGLDGGEIRRSVETELERLLGEDPSALLNCRRPTDISAMVEHLDESTSENETQLGRRIAFAIHKCITT